MPSLIIELEAAQRAYREHNATINEGGYGFNPHAAKVEALIEKLADLNQAAELVEWDRNETLARRTAWNVRTMVRYGGKMQPKDLGEMHKHFGWTMWELKAHIARHGL